MPGFTVAYFYSFRSSTSRFSRTNLSHFAIVFEQMCVFHICGDFCFFLNLFILFFFFLSPVTQVLCFLFYLWHGDREMEVGALILTGGRRNKDLKGG